MYNTLKAVWATTALCHPLDAKLPLDLSPPLLPLHLLPDLLRLLRRALLALLALPFLIQRPALHDARHNLRSVHVLELVICDLAVNVERLGDGVGVVGQRHELGDAVVDGDGRAVGEREKEGFGEGEGGAEDGGVDVLDIMLVYGWEI
jgi:hypothetical protein